jgi:hypothetical protein
MPRPGSTPGGELSIEPAKVDAVMSARIKYPRTPHFPFSPGRGQDDRVLESCAHFEGVEVVASVKMDGENTTLYRDGSHARSIDGRHHPSRDWLKGFHAQLAHRIPEGWRVCGENLYARHSIAYETLPSYFLGFSVWTDQNEALSWNDTLKFFAEVEILPVPVIFEGVFNEKVIRTLAKGLDANTQEGLVVRKTSAISYAEFGTSVAKWVRPQHVQTDQHWSLGPIVPNKLAK